MQRHSAIREFVAAVHYFMQVFAKSKEGDTEPTMLFIEARCALIHIIEDLRLDVPNIDTDDSSDSFGQVHRLMKAALKQAQYSARDLGLAYDACLVFAFSELPSEDAKWTAALSCRLDACRSTKDLTSVLRELRANMKEHRERYIAALPTEQVAPYKLAMTKVVVSLCRALHAALYPARLRNRKHAQKKSSRK